MHTYLSGWLSLNYGVMPPRRLESLGGANHLAGYLGIMIPLPLAWGVATPRRSIRIGLWLLGGLLYSRRYYKRRVGQEKGPEEAEGKA